MHLLSTTTLTDNFADTTVEVDVLNQSKIYIFIDYNKIDETELEMEVYYRLFGHNVWAKKTEVSVQNDKVTVEHVVFRFLTTMVYRLVFTTGLQEDRIRFAFRTKNTVASPGNIQLCANLDTLLR